MKTIIYRSLLVTVMSTLLSVPSTAGYAEEAHPGTHREVQGVVIEKGGSLSVQTPDGSTYQLNPNRSRRHGHEPPKVGDEVTVVFDENNLVSEIHPKGTQGTHRFVTGNLIKLKTPEGEQVFPLEKIEVKTGGIEEGASVTVELNEAGSVIDLHRADSNRGEGKH